MVTRCSIIFLSAKNVNSSLGQLVISIEEKQQEGICWQAVQIHSIHLLLRFFLVSMSYWQFTHRMSHRKWYIQICLQFVMLLGWWCVNWRITKQWKMEGLSLSMSIMMIKKKTSIQSTKRPIGNNNNASDTLIDTNIKMFLEC